MALMRIFLAFQGLHDLHNIAVRIAQLYEQQLVALIADDFRRFLCGRQAGNKRVQIVDQKPRLEKALDAIVGAVIRSRNLQELDKHPGFAEIDYLEFSR